MRQKNLVPIESNNTENSLSVNIFFDNFMKRTEGEMSNLLLLQPYMVLLNSELKYPNMGLKEV